MGRNALPAGAANHFEGSYTVLSSSIGDDPRTGDRSRMCFTHSDGSVVTLVITRPSTSTWGYKVFRQATLGAATTLVETVTLPANSGQIMNWHGLTAAMDVTGSIGVVYKNNNNNTLIFRKLTLSAGDYSAGAEVTAYTAPAGSRIESFDVAYTAGAHCVVAFNESTAAGVTLKVRSNINAGAWGTVLTQAINNGEIRRKCDAVSLVQTQTVAVGGNGGYAFVVASATGSPGVDTGVQIFSFHVKSADGTLSAGTLTQRGTYFSGEGDSVNTVSIDQPGRNIKLFGHTTAGKFILAVQHRDLNKTYGMMIGKFDGTTYTVDSPMTSQQYTGTIGVPDLMAMSADENSVNFFFTYHFDVVVKNVIAKFNPAIDASPIKFSGPYTYLSHATATNVRVYGISGNGGVLNLAKTRGEMYRLMRQRMGTFDSNTDKLWTELAWHGGSAAAGNPVVSQTVTQPTANQVVNTARPQLTVSINHPGLASSKFKLRWQISASSDFSSTIVDYIEPDSELVFFEKVSSYTKTIPLPNAYSLPLGTYYARVATIDEWDDQWAPTANNPPFSGAVTFSVLHPPTANLISPTGGKTYPWDGVVDLNFDWEFQDTSPGDYQTAFQIQIMDEVGTIISDSGKEISPLKRYTTYISDTYQDATLQWRVKLWDSNDSPGNFSAPAFFVLSEPPEIMLSDPPNGSVLPTGMPTITVMLFLRSATDKAKEVSFLITKEGQPVWTERVAGTWNDLDVLEIQVPAGVLENNTTYSVSAYVITYANLSAWSDIHQFTTGWVYPPAGSGIDADETYYSQEKDNVNRPGGYIKLTWEDTNRDDDFYSWNIYRRDDLYDFDMEQVLEAGEWKMIHQEFQVAPTYEFFDYFAPTGYRTVYSVRQQVNRTGQNIESLDSALAFVVPQSDGYWLIQGGGVYGTVDTTKLSIVTADSFTKEQEEAEWVVIGKGRVVNRGEIAGIKGTLDAQLRNTGGTTARQKRLRLEDAQESLVPMWLRNPFGDVYRVNVSSLSLSRVAGVGSAEFVDVSIPYSEISS